MTNHPFFWPLLLLWAALAAYEAWELIGPDFDDVSHICYRFGEAMGASRKQMHWIWGYALICVSPLLPLATLARAVRWVRRRLAPGAALPGPDGQLHPRPVCSRDTADRTMYMALEVNEEYYNPYLAHPKWVQDYAAAHWQEFPRMGQWLVVPCTLVGAKHYSAAEFESWFDVMELSSPGADVPPPVA